MFSFILLSEIPFFLFLNEEFSQSSDVGNLLLEHKMLAVSRCQWFRYLY